MSIHGRPFECGGELLPNGRLQQVAANRSSTPQDVITIVLQGFVRSSVSVHSPERVHGAISKNI
jgi:hypothetical protein